MRSYIWKGKYLWTICSILLTLSSSLRAQYPGYNLLFDDTLLNSVYIQMNSDSLEEMYSNFNSGKEYHATFIYQYTDGSDTVYDTGIRLRGNTSLSSAKKSFKISFNSYVEGRRYRDVKKLNLIGNHNDPTMCREMIYLWLYNQMGEPVRRGSFVKVFINGNYYGLYTNLEEYDEIFLKDRFGENSGNLYKCLWGGNMQYLGTNQSSYYNKYELSTNEVANDYSDLIHFLDVLNNTPIADLPCTIEKIFNVDNFLKIYALDISSGHWDSYAFNQNNYYIYHNQLTGKFEFLSYDCDNTYGVDWFGVNWTNKNIYTWNESGRPLVERLLQIPEYRDRFSYYIRTLSTGIMDADFLFPHIDSMRNLIADAAADDMYRTYDYGYTYDDFWNGFDENNIDDHTPFGIKPFLTNRISNNLLQAEVAPYIPVITHFGNDPFDPQPGSIVTLQARFFDDTGIEMPQLHYSYDNTTFYTADMYDDGVHNDLAFHDGIYAVNVEAPDETGDLFFYYTASDPDGNSVQDPICDSYVLHVGYSPPALVINECMARNDSTIADDHNEYDDWIEIYNAGDLAINLDDYFLSDEKDNPDKFHLPKQMLAPDQYLMIWLDDQKEQGIYHAGFKLDGDGEHIAIYASAPYHFAVVDSFTFIEQTPDISTGRLPNGTGPVVILPGPTPGYNNEEYAVPGPPLDEENILTLLGNPAKDVISLQLQLSAVADFHADLYAISGQRISGMDEKSLPQGVYNIEIDAAHLQRGIYLLDYTIDTFHGHFQLCFM
ncbi:MAG: CotH kinase family protein [Chitinophagales bacterium]